MFSNFVHKQKLIHKLFRTQNKHLFKLNDVKQFVVAKFLLGPSAGPIKRSLMFCLIRPQLFSSFEKYVRLLSVEFPLFLSRTQKLQPLNLYERNHSLQFCQLRYPLSFLLFSTSHLPIFWYVFVGAFRTILIIPDEIARVIRYLNSKPCVYTGMQSNSLLSMNNFLYFQIS